MTIPSSNGRFRSVGDLAAALAIQCLLLVWGELLVALIAADVTKGATIPAGVLWGAGGVLLVWLGLAGLVVRWWLRGRRELWNVTLAWCAIAWATIYVLPLLFWPRFRHWLVASLKPWRADVKPDTADPLTGSNDPSRPNGSNPQYASWGKRALAVFVDWMIVGGLLTVPAIGIATVVALLSKTPGELFAGYLLHPLTALFLPAFLFYLTWFDGRNVQGTPGRRSARIEVRNAATLEPIGFRRAFVRSLALTVLWAGAAFLPAVLAGSKLPLSGLFLLDVLWPLWDRRNQALHDKVARTVVVPSLHGGRETTPVVTPGSIGAHEPSDPASIPTRSVSASGVVWMIVAAVAIVVLGCVLAVVVFRVPGRLAHALETAIFGPCGGHPTVYPGTLSWSPDGHELAFTAPGKCGSGIDEIVVVGRDGMRRHVVMSSSLVGWPAWSPDGKSILVLTADGLVRIRAGGGDPVVLRRAHSEWGASWSPDGKRIAWTIGRSVDCSASLDPSVCDPMRTGLYVMDADGSRSHLVLGHSCDPGTPAWSPDGKSIAVDCEKGGISVIRLSDRTLRHLPAVPLFDSTVNWSPDGQTIAYAAGPEPGAQEIMRVPASGSRLPHVLRMIPSGGVQTAAFSPDGRSIAYSVSYSGQYDGLYIGWSDGRNTHRISRW